LLFVIFVLCLSLGLALASQAYTQVSYQRNNIRQIGKTMCQNDKPLYSLLFANSRYVFIYNQLCCLGR